MDDENISVRFVEERVRLGYSQVDFGRSLGITRQALANYENAKRTVPTKVLHDAMRMGLDVHYVLSGLRSASEPAPPVATSMSFNDNSGVGIAMTGASVSVINTTRHVSRTIARVAPGELHISELEAVTLKGLVDEVVALEEKLKKKPASHRAAWSRLNSHCGVTSYRLIRRTDFAKARSYLDQWMGRLNSSASAAVKDGDNWRKRRYAYIKVNSKLPEDAAALDTYIKREFSASSISDLSNDELERAYRYVAGRRNKAK